MVLCAVMTAVSILASCGSADSGDEARSGKSAMRDDRDGVTYDNGGDIRAENEDGGFYGLTMDMAEWEPDMEEYSHYNENEFKSVSENPLSTFSTDVDTASYTNVRRMINNGTAVDPDAVRTEEFINYFKYAYPQPEDGEKIGISAELTDCPWNDEAKLMMIGLQAEETEVRDIDSNIVFLIDVSGSMESEDKLPLVRQAFSLLSENLGQNDRISIVTYAGADKVVLEGENGANYDRIKECLDSLTAGGSTAGAAGINTAYELAERYFIEGGNNRVILATDGDLNVGVSTEEGLVGLIEEKRDKGIFLSVLGFGTGNYKDNKLEAIADNGNGNYAYIDSVDEARRVLVSEMNGTLFTVAKDIKVQVEFDPETVAFYRLVGYENRLLEDKDFEDDSKDAGDVGAGQQVTVLYEIIPEGSMTHDDQGQELDGLGNAQDRLMTVSVRYKKADEDESRLIESEVNATAYRPADEMSSNMVAAVSAAMFARALKGSEQGVVFTFSEILEFMDAHGLADGYSELRELVEKCV